MDKEQIKAIAESIPMEQRFSVEQIVSAAIESYKAELLKEVGEPVAEVIWFDPALELFPSKQPHKIIDGSMSFMDSSKIGTKFYTSDQVAAAILKATKPLEEEIDRLESESEEYAQLQSRCFDGGGSHASVFDEVSELRAQLAAAQEEIAHQRDENVKLVMAMSDTQINALAAIKGSSPDDIATIGKQCFEIAKLRVDLKDAQDQLAKAEQRVAEWQPIETNGATNELEKH